MALSATSDGPSTATWQNVLPPLFSRPSSDNVLLIWTHVRAQVLAPILDAAVVLCMAMSFMLLLEAVFMNAVSLYVKLFRRTPEKRYKWEAMEGDAEKGGLDYPLVLVQIPMYNEKEETPVIVLGLDPVPKNAFYMPKLANQDMFKKVYQLSIRAACALTWPPDRIIIQILDDSTDPLIKNLVKVECEEWAKNGINIRYEIRSNRKGYKAGALKKGMEHHYAQQCDLVAIFDADFQPDSDFLLKTVPFLVHNPEISLVQARWEFVNYSATLMTRIQKMSLDYHFKVEQESGSTTFSFFGFNGTAGVWRISSINEAGGWKDHTTVEDMDLAVRATLKGWKFLYVGDIRVKSELPSTLKAYRHQQHRWTCGAVNLFKKMGWDIATNKEVSLLKKIHVLYSFFFVRRVIAPIVTFCFYCVVIPISVLIPEVSIPVWGLVYIPTTITILNATNSPRSLHLMPFWILFENVMAMHRMRAAMVGLLGMRSVNDWVVTEKKGQLVRNKADIEIPLLEPAPTKCAERVYVMELGLAVFLLMCATYSLLFGNSSFYIYVYLQAVAFTVVGFGFIGAPDPTS